MNRNGCGPSGCRPVTDFGKNPLVLDIHQAANRNQNFRTALWTGEHLQVTLMCIPVGEEIGLEMHDNLDQLLRIEEGCALIQMGKNQHTLSFQRRACAGHAIVIPACTWHNIKNIGSKPLKLFSVYAPPQHPFGTVHTTKQESLLYE